MQEQKSVIAHEKVLSDMLFGVTAAIAFMAVRRVALNSAVFINKCSFWLASWLPSQQRSLNTKELTKSSLLFFIFKEALSMQF